MSLKVLAAVVLLIMQATGVLAQSSPKHTDAVLERLNNANQWRDHIMVVGHRAGVKENGVVVRPENSLEAIRSAVRMGLEIVELDVEKTADGAYVILHDTWLDRTTTCTGKLIERSLASLKDCRLRRGDLGPATDERIPTLRDALEVAKGRVLVNIDNKRTLADLPAMIAIARELGMEEQIVIKQNLWSTAKVEEARALLNGLGSSASFMPIIADDAIEDPGFVEAATDAVGAGAVEMVHWRKQAGPMSNGGALFAPRMRAVAARNDFHLWINTYSIVNKPAGYLSGGRGDEMASIASNPDDVFGFWVERGATIIQTDEPKAALEWLEKNGYRRPYGPATDETAAVN